MWFLEIILDDRPLARLRLPAAGLRFGPDTNADLRIPGLAQPVEILPAREAIWVSRGGGPRVEVSHDGALELGGLTFRAVRDDEPTAATAPRAPSRTKTLRLIDDGATFTEDETTLRITDGPDAPRDFPLDHEVVLGSHAACDLVLTDDFVSGRHLRLRRAGDGFDLTDLDSRNGTFLDGVRVRQARWTPGQLVRLGKTTLALATLTRREAVALTDAVEFSGLVGRSLAMRRVFTLIDRVAATDATVLIQGPSGTGKELVARALHTRGDRAAGPFIAVNCGSMVRELVAGELFGHVRGAFTGAIADRAGIFEIARGGTVFLDEIGEFPLDLQPNLLRVLEQHEVRRVGGSREIPVDVRILAATHRDLPTEVAAGRFREDLYYRLAMIPIHLPALADRPEDLPLLVDHLLAREARRLKRPAPRLTDAARAALAAHSWPGNVRELANCLGRAILLSGERGALEPADLLLDHAALAPDTDLTLAEMEAGAIHRAQLATPTRKDAAARLGIAVSTLYDKIKKYDLE